VFNIFLQILDEGRLTDTKGRTVDFRNSLIVMTSNIGTSYISDTTIPMEERYAGVEADLKNHFKPEFLNRIDEKIIFNPLEKEHIGGIVKLQLAEVAKRIFEQRSIRLEISKKALAFLVDTGYDPQFGARPLKRAIQSHLLNPLSVKLLEGNIVSEKTVKIDSNQNGLIFKVV
jgi:ATP-dependent Clp protease ATP-binding subunit ClpB